MLRGAISHILHRQPSNRSRKGLASLHDDNGNDNSGVHEGEAKIAMASPMPAAQSSSWSNTPAAGEVDEYGLQTKFMNCMEFSPLPLSLG